MRATAEPKSAFYRRDLISIEELSKEEILSLLEAAKRMREGAQKGPLAGKLVGSCFFEPSTRTRLSFEAAVKRLGGDVIGFYDDSSTSMKKGESLRDAMKMVEHYVDAIIIRHALEGSARWVADNVSVPVINAGDGANQHPTQTLLDLYTIQEAQGRLEEINIAIAGDLRHGRTVHSLALACAYFNMRLYFVAPPSLELPKEVCAALRGCGVRFSFHQKIEEVLPKADILYMTRIQEERFLDTMEYERVKSSFCLKKRHLEGARENLRILHPLPRVHEIATDVDATPHAYYYRQAKNGLYVRQALLAQILEGNHE